MASIPADTQSRTNRVLTAVVAGGLTAATFDFLVAMTLNQLDAITIGKAIARGWYGKAAMQGGLDVALIGVASHYTILLAASAIFVFASLRFPILRRMAWIVGPLFGAAIYGVMHYLILPLSAVHAIANPKGVKFVWEFCGHMFLVGLPIALWSRAILGKA
jgi:uncharacterized membrane protein YagU involved in acid resistance